MHHFISIIDISIHKNNTELILSNWTLRHVELNNHLPREKVDLILSASWTCTYHASYRNMLFICSVWLWHWRVSFFVTINAWFELFPLFHTFSAFIFFKDSIPNGHKLIYAVWSQEEVPGKVEDSKHSNANYADSQQLDENSIPEGHSSGASEENDEHEHDYGETDCGNNDCYNDMYFENEEDDYHYAEDYDWGMLTQNFFVDSKISTHSFIYGQYSLATISPFDFFSPTLIIYMLFVSFEILTRPRGVYMKDR